VANPAPKHVESGSERYGTGRFDALDDVLLTTILTQVPFSHRLCCATSVCKAWRSLHQNHTLWTELAVAGGTGTFTGYSLYNYDQGAVPCSSKGLSRLIAWLPSLSNVTKLNISAGRPFSLCEVRLGPSVFSLETLHYLQGKQD